MNINITSRFTPDKNIEIFRMSDNFCKEFNQKITKHQIPEENNWKQRIRSSHYPIVR
jgi:hypothetical protein